jgi:hypothetical protein
MLTASTNMPLQISVPEAFIVGHASLADGGRWIFGLFDAVRDAVHDDSSVEILDEECLNAAGDIASYALKISERLPESAYAQLSEAARSASRNGAEHRLLRAVATPDQVLNREDVSTEYFRREFAVDSQFIVNRESGVKLTHRPTGLTARCTAHRHKERNIDEALFLLAALVANSGPMRVYLDDERNTPEGWVRVYWPDEAIRLLEAGSVVELSLDHDLGDDDRGTGYDVVLWIEEAVALRGFKAPKISVHSANSSAREKMVAGIQSIERMVAGK